MATTIEKVYQLIIDAGGSKAGAEMFRQSAEKISAAAQKAAAAGKPITDNVAQQARAYERLRREIDPLYAAEVRLAQGLQLLETRFRTGNLGAEEMARDVAALKAQFDRAAASAGRMGGSVGGVRNLGTAFQQAGYQVGDFAVQVASGQGFLRPLIQQGTQLISMFGPWGAVIGAAGAVVGALATAFWDVSDAGEDAADALDGYVEAMRAAEDLNQQLNGTVGRTVDSLKAEKRYRLELAEAELSAIQVKMALLHATVAEEAVQQSPDDIGAALDNIEKSLKPRMDALKAILNGDGTDDNPGLRAIIAELKYGGEGLDGRSNMGLDFGGGGAGSGSGPKAPDDAGADAISALKERIALYGDLTNEERALYEVTSGRYKDESAAEKEQILQLSRILDLKSEIAEATKEQADAAREAERAEVAGYDAIIESASNAWENRVKAGQKLTEEVRTPLETYLATITDLNAAYAVGTIDITTYNRQVANAQDAFTAAGEGATYFRDVADDAMSILQAGLFDAAFEADNLSDALAGVLKQLAKMAANKAFGAIADKGLDFLFGLFSSPGGGILDAGGMGSGAGGAAFSNHSGGIAGSGPTRAVDPGWFSTAPRYHGGGQIPGLRPNEVPIIAEEGETIRTTAQESALQARMSSAGQRGPVVINNNIKIEGSAGKPEENNDLIEKLMPRLERSMKQLVDERIVDQTRGGGELNKSAMTF